MTNQNNELDKILDKYIGFDDMSPTHMQNAKREINNLLDSMDMNGYKRGFKEAQALYAPLKKQQNVNISTEHVKPVNMSLRQAIQDLPEHLDRIMELVNKTPKSVDLTKPEVNLIDIASPNMTPEASKVVSEAIERSAEVMNKVAKPVENGELNEIKETRWKHIA